MPTIHVRCVVLPSCLGIATPFHQALCSLLVSNILNTESGVVTPFQCVLCNLLASTANSAVKTDAILPLSCFKYASALDCLLMLLQQIVATQYNA